MIGAKRFSESIVTTASVPGTRQTIAFLESERRLGDRWVAALEARWLLNEVANTPLNGLRRDDSMTLRLSRYF